MNTKKDIIKIIESSKHCVKIGSWLWSTDNKDINDSDVLSIRKKVEPWLSGILQSEHLSMLIGTGLTQGLCKLANVTSSSMSEVDFKEFSSTINIYAEQSAKNMGRDNYNIEDQIRTSFQLLEGYQIMDDKVNLDKLKIIINDVLTEFTDSILNSEKNFYQKLEENDINANLAFYLLISFILTFSSRNATRDRLHIFTTNYDRFIEHACDNSSIKVLDRFFGKIQPYYQETLPNIDYFYKIPDSKNEFRYAEGVIRYTKIHGSIDWYEKNNKIIQAPLPFGSDKLPSCFCDLKSHLMIYPNSMKSIETAYYPYSQLFRDFSSSICRPNSSLFIYGYGFGDSHINKILLEMLQIPSTHIVIASYLIDAKLITFLKSVNMDQLTLLCGEQIASLDKLVYNYLPISAIDKITDTVVELQKKREIIKNDDINNQEDNTIETTKISSDKSLITKMGKVISDNEVICSDMQ